MLHGTPSNEIYNDYLLNINCQVRQVPKLFLVVKILQKYFSYFNFRNDPLNIYGITWRITCSSIKVLMLAVAMTHDIILLIQPISLQTWNHFVDSSLLHAVYNENSHLPHASIYIRYLYLSTVSTVWNKEFVNQL